MVRQLLPLFIMLALLQRPLYGQDYLEIEASKHCLYFGDAMPGEYYRFETSDSIEHLKDEILYKTGKPQSFIFICSNVPSVVAVVEGEKRYILYSRKFFSEHPNRALRLALLAHEIGHHVNRHELAEGKPTEVEEMEADEFMGYALCLTGVPAQVAGAISGALPLASGIDTADRNADIMRGFRRAEASLLNAEHAAWLEEKPNEVAQSLPHFPFPPPEYSADADLDSYFGHCKHFSDADEMLRKALEAAGYHTRRYFYVPGGFALVTRMEQFNEDGTCKGEKYRWSGKIVRCEDFSALCYLKSIVTTEPAYFRVFVFIVSPQLLKNAPPPVTRKEAEGWLNEGANRLPADIGGFSFEPGKTHVTALVYEFKVRESDRKSETSSPSALEGATHLGKSKITRYLTKK
ncbi:MAG: hypothetical protein H6575_06910 [Lewinellaceae bacterium]|nr:hypothetical protein [Lewinellaceae bacterium]